MIDKRIMYAQGQRVAKSLDGSRPGYRGSDMATVGVKDSKGNVTTAANTSAKNTSGADYGGGNQGGGGSGKDGQGNDYSDMTGKQISDSYRSFQLGVDPAYSVVSDKGPTRPYSEFRNFKPEVPKIPLGFGSLIMNMINPDGKGALQMFSDFSAGKNRNYFMDEVVRAGKIPGLSYGTVKDMTGAELETAYKDYMSNRLSGSTDAYGNPIGGQDKPGITSIYDARPYQMAQNIQVEDPVQQQNGIFASRFLQNKTPGEREAIEANMPIRFPNLFT